jgi:hypothetical protein
MPSTLWKLAAQVCEEIEAVSMHISPFDGEITDRRLKESARAPEDSEGHDPGNRGGVLLVILLWRFAPFRRLVDKRRHEKVSEMVRQTANSSYDDIKSGVGVGNRCTNLLESLTLNPKRPGNQQRRIHLLLLRTWEITGRVAMLNPQYRPGLTCVEVLNQIQTQKFDDRNLSDVWVLFYVHLYGYKMLELKKRYPVTLEILQGNPDNSDSYVRDDVELIGKEYHPIFANYGSKCWRHFLWCNLVLFNILNLEWADDGAMLARVTPIEFIDALNKIRRMSWANKKVNRAVSHIIEMLREFEEQRRELGDLEGFWFRYPERIDDSTASGMHNIRLLPRRESPRVGSPRVGSPRVGLPRARSQRRERSKEALDEILTRLENLQPSDLELLQQRVDLYLAWNRYGTGMAHEG